MTIDEQIKQAEERVKKLKKQKRARAEKEAFYRLQDLEDICNEFGTTFAKPLSDMSSSEFKKSMLEFLTKRDAEINELKSLVAEYDEIKSVYPTILQQARAKKQAKKTE